MRYQYRIVKFKSGNFGIQAKAPATVPTYWTTLKERYSSKEKAQAAVDDLVIVEVGEVLPSLGE